MTDIFKKRHATMLKNFLRSVWFFPSAITLLFITLTVLGIHGSSIGSYHQVFDGGKDESLILNHPRGVRTDEWLISSPLIIAQERNDYKVINQNIGHGEDVAVVGDIPYRDWSIVFKPQNIGFFIFPFDNAFAFRWWFMAYVLVLSAYFFVYLFLAKNSKRIAIAALLSLALFFSPFIQWWYLIGTIAPMAYSLLGLCAFMLLIRTKKISHAAMLGALVFYIATCFCLVLYPPFQIPCALVMATMMIAIFLERRKQGIPLLRQKIIIIITSLVGALLIVGLFLYQHKSTVDIISNTSYPGHRVAESGTVNARHFFASHLARLFTDDGRANAYMAFMGRLTNQSEASNFILTLPFTVIILAIALINSIKKRRKISFVSIAILTLTLLFCAWLFIPGLGIVGKITLLDKVPPIRLLIGVGLLNFIAFIEAIRILEQQKERFSLRLCLAVAASVLLAYLAFNLYVFSISPVFIGLKWLIVLAFPIPLIIFFLLRKNFTLAACTLLLFSFLSTYEVNPLYRGTASLSETRLSQSIQSLSRTNKKAWVSENMISANLITMSGARSISGTYYYPQNNLWERVDKTDKSIYNRYANVLFMFDRDEKKVIPDHIKAIGDDQFWVELEPCSNALKRLDVGFIMTVSPFTHDEAPCLTLASRVSYPTASFFIYKIQ